MPYGIKLTVEPGPTGNGFAADTSSPVFAAACAAWSEAWGAETITAGGGGSIPIVSALAQASPKAVVMLGGATDGYANIHGPNERVLLDEFEKTTLAIADFLGRMAAHDRGERLVSAEAATPPHQTRRARAASSTSSSGWATRSRTRRSCSCSCVSA